MVQQGGGGGGGFSPMYGLSRLVVHHV
ncbi:MAG: hypothetical protein ACI8XZ_005652, partial [Gammaproteobacteria bacterium]